jgi:hypothetical protein
MDPTLLPVLAGLALVDSTSIGTLLLPLWLMTAPSGLRPRRLVAFLGVVAGFYFLVGSSLLLGGSALFDRLGSGIADARPVALLQLAVGAALLVLAFRIGKDTQARMNRWRDRAVGGETGSRRLVTLALLATTLELATMLPYLAAIGLLAGSDVAAGLQVVVLAAYCLVMVVPALVLLAVRMLLRDRIDAVLPRLSDWLERAGAEATGWVFGIAGFLVARDAIARLLL